MLFSRRRRSACGTSTWAREADGIMTLSLNRRGLWVVEALVAHADERRVAGPSDRGGWTIHRLRDRRPRRLVRRARSGADLPGDLALVSLVPGEVGGRSNPLVQVVTDHPVLACLASQYAGWAIKEGKFFAMGSGPMRAAAGTEAIFDVIGFRETADAVIGVLETRKPPPPAVVATIAAACRVEPAQVTLLAAPTASLAGGVQVVARSVETALAQAGRA